MDLGLRGKTAIITGGARGIGAGISEVDVYKRQVPAFRGGVGMSNHRPQRGPMGGGPAAARPAEKAKDFRGTFKKLMRYIRAYWFSLIVMLVFAVASTVFTIIGPKILGNATNKLEMCIRDRANGPVCPELFRKHSGMYRVREEDIEGDIDGFTQSQRETMDAVLEHYGDKEPYCCLLYTSRCV